MNNERDNAKEMLETVVCTLVVLLAALLLLVLASGCAGVPVAVTQSPQLPINDSTGKAIYVYPTTHELEYEINPGEAWLTWKLQSSSNLVQWQTLQTVSGTGTVTVYSASNPQFYRLKGE